MSERLNVRPEELRQAAREHRATAERLGAASSHHPDVMATLDSLGPVFADLRDAGAEVLDQRRACYEQQAVAHAELADRLSDAADAWELHDADAARQLRTVGEGVQ